MCLSAIVVLVCLGAAAGTAPLAETVYGPIRGHLMTSLSGREFLAFNGVPYARPPVGKLRFKEPEAPEKHADVLDVTKDAEDCFQDDHFFNQYPQDLSPLSLLSGTKRFVGSEDCLYLNIYTPNLKPSSPLPVMVFIHGGAFKIGSGASNLHGPEILMDKDIILITINYRLGILGFLRTDDTLLPGNLGLKDQVAALKWVKENVANFGGNPNSVTIFGESAGGASVHLQMHSPLSRGLFHRVIAQSGTGDSVWAIKDADVSEEIGIKYLELVGCQLDNKLIDCLQEKSVEEVFGAGNTMLKFGLDMKFSPVFESNKDSSFITKESFSERSSLPLMSGITSSEGLILIGEMFMAGDTDLSGLRKDYKTFLPTLLNYENSPNKDVISNKIKELYLGSKDFGLDTMGQTVKMFSDGLFNSALYKSSKNHKGPVYQYYLSYKGEKSFAKLIPNLDYDGVDHGDDLLYLFHLKKFFPKLKFNEKDGRTSKLIVDLWVNFATYGDPTPNGVPAKWEKSKKAQGFVDIGEDGLTPKKKLFDSDRMHFWEFFTAVKTVHTEL